MTATLTQHDKARRYMRQQINRLLARHNDRIVTLKSAPDEAALALIYYMAINGEAWELAPAIEGRWVEQEDFKRRFIESLPWYRERFGQYRFGLVTIPMRSLIPLVMKSGDIPTDWPNFAAYHKWYCDEGNMPDHDITKPLWPVILDGDCGDEVFQDGWHRFHHYYRSGVKQVPCIYYLPGE